MKRLHDLRKSGVILCMERSHDFYVWRGCVIFLTHSPTQVAWFIFFWRLRDFFFAERLCDFLLREFVILCVKRLLNFLCEEAA